MTRLLWNSWRWQIGVRALQRLVRVAEQTQSYSEDKLLFHWKTIFSLRVWLTRDKSVYESDDRRLVCRPSLRRVFGYVTVMSSSMAAPPSHIKKTQRLLVFLKSLGQRFQCYTTRERAVWICTEEKRNLFLWVMMKRRDRRGKLKVEFMDGERIFISSDIEVFG